MKVLISLGFGAGWSTWNDSRMATDEDLIALFESGCTPEEMKGLCLSKGYTDVYMGGFEGLAITEVPKGVHFRIREYDGAETIEIMEAQDWIYAED